MTTPITQPPWAQRGKWLVWALALTLLACGGSGGSAPAAAPAVVPGCGNSCAADTLSTAEVETLVSQAVVQAQALGARATIAVTDRVGNVLAVFSMPGAASTFRINGGRGVRGGLEQVDTLPSTLAAISKALTGAYLSSAGNAFSTRTASQIVQQNFNPQEANQPSGPLFGVQFSQLGCSDLMRKQSDASLGPKRAPLGLSADPGGLPVYKGGRLVGGVGVMADGVYGLDVDIRNIDNDLDEQLALAAVRGFEAPADITANRITLDGRSLRYVDAVAGGASTATPGLSTLPGSLLAVAGYFDPPVRPGVAFGSVDSGLRADSAGFATHNAYIVVDGANNNLYPPRASTDGLVTATEARQLLASALDVANRSRAQIRKPSGSTAQITVSVVGVDGDILGIARSPDAPVFSLDVSVQKARSAAFFSNPGSGAALQALPDASYLNPVATSSIGSYVTQLRNFLNRPTALSDGLAFSARSVGNLARPLFPDGITATGNGPLSKPLPAWSPFSTGLQLDLSINAITGTPPLPAVGCTGLPNLKNGLQIFPGGFPLYRVSGSTAQLVGAVGVSGDGVDQDDMVAFLGIANASRILGTGLGHAPTNMRADSLALPGGPLRYVQCPQAPYNNSDAQNVCAGL
ncbi:heme-binding protein [Rhodoferax sp. AJA081-3]|uniref:heme-binding protein n=1 Tax=Rhodoferax sp. AJA081-3 TaxID=2752316 RepID=UPI001ADF77BA|nr:heme-binding protein [Rhodoferax sp. AJA081-3]QTN27582.1 heme-binding protein [Rhodoferax sp. AJA081-3]